MHQRGGAAALFWFDEDKDEDGPWSRWEDVCMFYFGCAPDELEKEDPDCDWSPSFLNED